MANVYMEDWNEKLQKKFFSSADIVNQSFAERSALGGSEVIGTSRSYWDAGRGVEVHASAGDDSAYFELLKGGGVRLKSGQAPAPLTGAPASSLFTQDFTMDNTGKKTAIEGISQDKLGITSAEGKEIKRTGQTIFNPTTGVDEHAGEGEILIEYTDGTVERRKLSNMQTPGETTAIGEFGRTAEQLGITRQTEIKAEDGSIARAPQSAKQVLDSMIASGASAEQIDQFLQSEGQSSTADFELIGKTYKGRTASEGNVFYQDPKTRTIIERPEALQSLAQASTSPTIASERADIPTLFQAVFGRQPTAEELKYWKGRTDKTGGALVGAMQFAKQQGQAMGGTPGSGDPVDMLNTSANDSQARLASLFSDAGVGESSSDRKALLAEIESLKAPKSESLADFTKEQLASTQFQEAQNDLNNAKNALRQMDTDYTNNLIEAERTPGLSMGAIRRNQTELDIAYQRARSNLVTEVQAYTDIVNSQLAITGMMIDAFKFDQQTAQTEYQNAFNRATTLYNMVRQDEMDAFNVQQKLQDNQRANLSVITSMLQSGNLKYEDLSAEQRAQITNMEQAVGLPAGFTSFVGTIAKDPEVTIGGNIVGADGTVMTPVYTVNPSTGEMKTTYITQPIKERVPSSGGSGKPTEGEITRRAISDMASNLNSVRGSDGYVAPDNFNYARQNWVSRGYEADQFNSSFRYYANPSHIDDYNLPE